MTMALPGISFEIVRSAGPVLGIRADRTAMIALTQRGPVEDPVLVHSHDEYVQQFGCTVDGMLGPLAAQGYYDNAGEELIVARFVPNEAERATGELDVVGASQPPGSFKIGLGARDPGAFGNEMRVDAQTTVRHRGKGVATSSTTVEFTGLLAPLFDSADVGAPATLSVGATIWTRIIAVSDLNVDMQTVTVDGDLLVVGESVVVEAYEPTFALRIREPLRADVIVQGLDLSDLETSQQLVAGSNITVDWPSTGGLSELPVAGVSVTLAGGDDGLEPGGNIDGLRSSFERALTALEASSLPDIVIAPDLWSRVFRTKGVDRLAFDASTAVELADEMVDSAWSTRDRIALLDPPLGGVDDLRPLATSELLAWRTQRQNALQEDRRDFVAAYTPWCRIVGGPVYKGDDTLLVPPSAYVAGQMALTSRQRGPWIATGNVALEDVIGLWTNLSTDDQEALQAVGINPLRVSLPRGSTIQGVRSLSWPDRKPWRFISTRRLFNYLRRAIRPIGMSYVFEPNAPATWVQLRRDLERLLRDLFAHGALAGSKPQEAFVVKVDESLNPEGARDAGVLTAEIGVAPAFPLEFLLVRLLVQAGEATVVEEPIAP